MFPLKASPACPPAPLAGGFFAASSAAISAFAFQGEGVAKKQHISRKVKSGSYVIPGQSLMDETFTC